MDSKSKHKVVLNYRHLALLIITFFILIITILGENDFLIILSDACFLVGIIFLLLSCKSLIINLGVFDIVKYSYKILFDFFKRKDKDKVSIHKISYAEYRDSNCRKEEYKNNMIFAILLLFLSLIVGIMI